MDRLIANPYTNSCSQWSFFFMGVGLLISESLNAIECVYNDEIKIKFKDGLYLHLSLHSQQNWLNLFSIILKHIQPVFIIYSGSKTALNGLVIGLSCLNGTK